MTDFDLVAADFERYRAWPDSVAEQIRAAVWRLAGDGAPILDVGAGTGRIGRAFVRAGDRYVGVDLSYEMLARFVKTTTRNGFALVQGDGCRLPFPSRTFAAVLLAHVLSASTSWQEVLREAVRVLLPNGVLVLGRQSGPTESIDRRMREQLRQILATMNIEMPVAGAARSQARAWMEDAAETHERIIAANWQARSTPRDFLLRHSTGARFVALPFDVRQTSMAQLSDWAVDEFGTLDAEVIEDRRFELEVFRFGKLRGSFDGQ